MTQTNPITPPPELVEQWRDGRGSAPLATKAARWGADQELEACCAWLPKMPPWSANDLRRHRRPKAPTLKEQALEALREAESSGCLYVSGRSDTIRRALEALDD